MQTENVTAQEIEEWLHTNKKKAAWLAQTIGVTKPTVSRWLNGQDIPEPMQNLLRLLIRGEVPPGFAQPRDPGILAFTPAEWRIIEVARAREGFDDSKEWIVSKIRAYLAMANIKPGPVAYESHEEWQARQEGILSLYPLRCRDQSRLGRPVHAASATHSAAPTASASGPTARQIDCPAARHR